jgi:hypothetical protein
MKKTWLFLVCMAVAEFSFAADFKITIPEAVADRVIDAIARYNDAPPTLTKKEKEDFVTEVILGMIENAAIEAEVSQAIKSARLSSIEAAKRDIKLKKDN